jgi:D-glycero-alpha-D-manno-heptose-7-phosphate kinase
LLNVHSLDYDVVAKYNVNGGLQYDGKLDLVKAVIKTMNINGDLSGLDLFTHSDAPPGSGLGSSSTMVVALLGAISHWLGRPMGSYEMSRVAYTIEREELGIKGGMQDQYAATFGGFNLMEFHDRRVIVNSLKVDRDIINELQYRLLLCYTGTTRLSAQIIDTQVRNYVEKRAGVEESLDNLKEITIEMKNCLLRGELDSFGALLHDSWESKKHIATQITNPQIDQLYSLARAHGAIGGKLLGAGGGGYLLLFCRFDRKHVVAAKLEEYGGQIVEFGFDLGGVQSWCPEQEPVALTIS